MARILVVEDDLQLRQGIEELLQNAGYEVAVAGDILSAGKLRSTVQKVDQKFDLYLLDIMLGRGSGFRLCQEIREKEDTPIIFLSALDDEEHVIEGLNLGADDYIAKPFRSRELLARVSAHLRRTGRKDERSVMESGEITYVLGEERVLISGEEITLRKVELALLKYFLESNGRLLQREQILEYIWENDSLFVEDNTLSVQISRLRKQIGRFENQEYIETLRGIGYRWCQPVRIKER